MSEEAKTIKKLHIKNQLESGNTIKFCCGDKEYALLYGEEITIEIEDEDCMYFDGIHGRFLAEG